MPDAQGAYGIFHIDVVIAPGPRHTNVQPELLDFSVYNGYYTGKERGGPP